jgi:bis(5'-nucleosyl)-tetraphosphatase (symmetrical)
MSTYAIGDIQGCYTAFSKLLKRLRFDPANDRLWLVGDLVNRGPQSREVLRAVMALGDRVSTVLGNHDLHLLAVAAGVRKMSRADTFADVLKAKDSDELLDWLRQRPLVIFNEKRNRLLVHAGIPPAWTVARTLKEAGRIEALLRGDDWAAALKSMYGNVPRAWSKSLKTEQKLRYTINALTRMRFCDHDGRLALEYSGPPGTQPKRFMPWFAAPNRKTADTHIYFGHWSSLGTMQRTNLTALDSGCVWGRRLTAIKLLRRSHPRTRVKCR